MTRFEEHEIVIDEISKRANNITSWTYEEKLVFQLSTISSMLMDISRSLAVIADKIESEDKK